MFNSLKKITILIFTILLGIFSLNSVFAVEHNKGKTELQKNNSKKEKIANTALIKLTNSEIEQSLLYLLTNIKRTYFENKNKNSGYGVLPIKSSPALNAGAACISNLENNNYFASSLDTTVFGIAVAATCNVNRYATVKVDPYETPNSLSKIILTKSIGKYIYTANQIGIYTNRDNPPLFEVIINISK